MVLRGFTVSKWLVLHFLFWIVLAVAALLLPLSLPYRLVGKVSECPALQECPALHLTGGGINAKDQLPFIDLPQRSIFLELTGAPLRGISVRNDLLE